ncbi:MAG: ATP-binding protein [Candidatus Sumerlaeaceae bacterium]|nr:ATP-binding protein [Candidatus Sumerlaeaceae bacterium]
MTGPRRKSAIVFYGVAIALLAASLAVLLQISRRFEQDLLSSLGALQRVFSDERVLRAPADPVVRFSAVEELARKYENFGYVRRLTVTKVFPGSERIIYPFYAPAAGDIPALRARLAEHPDPAAPRPDERALPLEAGGVRLGTLHLRLDEGPLASVRAAIASLGLLLLGAVALLALQFRQQEHVISRTTVELEQKRRELIRLERLALAGQLSANILHDLKKPVLNIKNEAEDPDAASPMRIREQADLFLTMLRESNLERFVRSEGDREYADVNDLLRRSLSLVGYERGNIEVALHLDPAIPPVLGMPVRFIQVFSNLILNAYQAMEGRGRLTVATRPADGGVLVTIDDTGPGIPETARESIFEPFYTTKSADIGTGLGLYICRDIIREAGGRIEVGTAPGGGARFTIWLPAGPDA